MKNQSELIQNQLMKVTSYKLIKHFDEFELRKYTPATTLEIVQIGSQSEALVKAKRMFLNMIQENKNIIINESTNNREIPEVLIEPLEERKSWKFEFFLENQKLPLNDIQEKIQLNNLPEKYYGAIKITGFMSNEKIVQKILLLKSWLAREKFSTIGKPKIAISKAYWNIALLKKVEIYIEVEPPPNKS